MGWKKFHNSKKRTYGYVPNGEGSGFLDRARQSALKAARDQKEKGDSIYQLGGLPVFKVAKDQPFPGNWILVEGKGGPRTKAYQNLGDPRDYGPNSPWKTMDKNIRRLREKK